MFHVPNAIKTCSRPSASIAPSGPKSCADSTSLFPRPRYRRGFRGSRTRTRTRSSPAPYVTPHQPLLGCPHFQPVQPHRPISTQQSIPSPNHLTPPATTTHHARAPKTVHAPADLVAALPRVYNDLVDAPLPHTVDALHVLVTWLPLRPPHWMVPRRPSWGEADEGGVGGDLVLGVLRRPVCGRCRVCV